MLGIHPKTIVTLNKQPSHLDAIAHHTWDLWQQEYISSGRANTLDDLKTIISSNSNRCYVILDTANNIIGAARVDEVDNIKSLHTPWLVDLFIVPKYRRQGLATQLINHIINVTPSELYLYCEPELETLYTNCGFTKIENATNSIVMQHYSTA